LSLHRSEQPTIAAAAPTPPAVAPRGSPLEVLAVATPLGLTSFGGPIAHLGYFRAEYVERRQWLDDQTYVDLVALCQFLPGPASSQGGISIGILRAG
jgi:chromate transporter